jgi:tetratricopeptide (TPR) repeat protein
MAVKPQLDALGGPRKGRVILFLAAVLILGLPGIAQDHPSEQARLSAAQEAFNQGRWEEAASLAAGPRDQSPDLDFLMGLALAHREKWSEAKLAFEAGSQKAPGDPRFLVELAGIAYKQKNFQTAKRRLHAAIRLGLEEAYPREFLATIYFLEGNLEAALDYWNPLDKPRLRSVAFGPSLKLQESLRNRALAFNAPQILTGDALLTTESRLNNLGLFSDRRIELAPADSGNFDLTLHLAERNAWGNSKLEGLLSLLGGLPYATVYPQYFNIGHRAVNFDSLVRWDPEKRRVALSLSMPLYGDPGLRLAVHADMRNENWNMTQTFFGAAAPLSNLNIRRAAAGAEIHSVVNGRWGWSGGVEIANRTFRNLTGLSSPAAQSFFTGNTSVAVWLGLDRLLWRVPERRFRLDSSVEARAGRQFAENLGPFGTLRGSVGADWYPRAKGDDYEMHTRVRAGGTAGKVTVDELFQSGIERDNDLWLRGHAGTRDGRKGAAPLGRRYVLVNSEMDKNIYRNGFFTLKLGPFLDTGAVADSSGLFGSQRWLWDSGIQCKVRILGGVTVLLSYGRDLRGGKGVFYGTVSR